MNTALCSSEKAIGLKEEPGNSVAQLLQKISYQHLASAWASLVAQLVKNLPAMRETQVQYLGWEDPLEKGKATTPVFWPGEFLVLYSP